MLRSYIIRFNKDALSIDETDDKILVVTSPMVYGRGSFCSPYTRTTQKPC